MRLGKVKKKKPDVIFQSHGPFYLRFGYGGGLARGSNRAQLWGTQRPFPPKYIENNFRLSRVLLRASKYEILSGANKFVSVRSS